MQTQKQFFAVAKGKGHASAPLFVSVSGLAFGLLAAVLFLGNITPVLAKNTAHATAEDLFRQLPTSIFDNTTESLNEDGKQSLLDQGFFGTWVVTLETPDRMRMATSGEEYGEVTVALLRAAAGGIVVLAAQTSDSCATELWQYNAAGGFEPFAGPEEPVPSEFFTPERGVPADVMPSYRICLEGNDLEAKPLFWNDMGLVDVTPDNRILFTWNGKAFEKNIVAVSRTTFKEAADVPPAVREDATAPAHMRGSGVGGSPPILGVPAPLPGRSNSSVPPEPTAGISAVAPAEISGEVASPLQGQESGLP